jgi:hypothetical protein
MKIQNLHHNEMEFYPHELLPVSGERGHQSLFVHLMLRFLGRLILKFIDLINTIGEIKK